MRPLICLAGALAGLSIAGAAHAERICTAPSADPAVTVSLHMTDDGMVEGGEVHWAVPNVRPDLPSMVHIVYPLDGDHAGTRPAEVIALTVVTGADIVHSPTASIQIVLDGMDMAVRAWDDYSQVVARLNQDPPAGGVSKASFYGAVTFTPSFQDGRRDVDSSEALRRIEKGARTMQVRLLGQDGMAMQDHTYRLFDMPAPAPRDVQAALAKAKQLAGEPGGCPTY
jgi:hypothetical protein